MSFVGTLLFVIKLGNMESAGDELTTETFPASLPVLVAHTSTLDAVDKPMFSQTNADHLFLG